VINGYLENVVDRVCREAGDNGPGGPPKHHAFNTFFYSTLREKGAEGVKRWAQRAGFEGAALLRVDTVFVPIHDHAHWTLMVVKPTARTIEHFDSLGGPSAAHVARVISWLRRELGSLFKEEEWRTLPGASPQQDNGSDCGVFLLTTAKLLAFGQPLNYGPEDIPLIRQRIAAELLNGGFTGDFDPRAEYQMRSLL
jgi:Ulp1 family protease